MVSFVIFKTFLWFVYCQEGRIDEETFVNMVSAHMWQEWSQFICLILVRMIFDVVLFLLMNFIDAIGKKVIFLALRYISLLVVCCLRLVFLLARLCSIRLVICKCERRLAIVLLNNLFIYVLLKIAFLQFTIFVALKM